MFVSKENKVLFVHIPKTAGTSITQSLKQSFPDGCSHPISAHRDRLQNKVRRLCGRQVIGKHSILVDVLKERPALSECFKFAVVRCPYDWLISLFKFIKYAELSPDTGLPFRHALHGVVAPMSFKEFIVWVTEKDGLLNLPSRKSSSLKKRTPVLQSDWVSGVTGELLIDHVLRFEKITEDWARLSKIIEFDLSPLLVRNVSRGKAQEPYYDHRLKTAVADYFDKDFSAFGYTK